MRKLAADGVNRMRSLVEIILAGDDGNYTFAARRTARTTLKKMRTSSPRWLTPRNLLLTRPQFALEVSRLDTVSIEKETTSPSMTGVASASL
jgi:hypothetical protein